MADTTERIVWNRLMATTADTGPDILSDILGTQTPLETVDTVRSNEHGDRIIHRYGRLGIIAAHSYDVAAATPSTAGASSPADITEVERLGLAALRLRESEEFRTAKVNRPRYGEEWDMHGCVRPVPESPTQKLVRLPGTQAEPAPAPTSSYLEGSVAVGIIVVEGPTADLRFTNAELVKVTAEVQEGLGFYAKQDPQAGLSFTYDIRNVIIDRPADPGLAPADREKYFRDPAMAALGFSANWQGVIDYVESIRRRFLTRWTYAVYFTKYPLEHFAYAIPGGPRVVMEHQNDGWGSDNIDSVFAHETGHIFGCPDEYLKGDCNCGGSWGRFGIANYNCESCAASGGVKCLMKHNDLELCQYTRRHLGWATRYVNSQFGYNMGWRIENHPRFAVDINGNHRADLVGFADDGVHVSLAQPDGSYSAHMLVLAEFGPKYGWQMERHPRFLADTNGNGRLDIVGFADEGVRLSRQQASGEFSAPTRFLPEFGYNSGWRVEKHPRFVVDINNNGCADIVGFGNDGVWVALAHSDGSYSAPVKVVQEFGYDSGWRIEKHPRFLADTTGNGLLDIIGFADEGVRLSRQRADGTFTDPVRFLPDFGYNATWRVEKHPRFVVDVTGDGRADIVGFGNGGVYLSLANPDGSYSAPKVVVTNFGYDQGWRIDRHPRFLADTTGDGLLDIVGIADSGVMVSRNLGGGLFEAPGLTIADFGYVAGGWRVEKHPRFLAETSANGRADVVGFGENGVYIARS